jgi:hypothetical protein
LVFWLSVPTFAVVRGQTVAVAMIERWKVLSLKKRRTPEPIGITPRKHPAEIEANFTRRARELDVLPIGANPKAGTSSAKIASVDYRKQRNDE